MNCLSGRRSVPAVAAARRPRVPGLPGLISVALALTAIATASEPKPAAPAWIEAGESIVVLESPQFIFDWDHQRRKADLDVRNCVSSALGKRYRGLRVIPQAEFVKVAFPDLPPAAAPISAESLKMLVGHETLKQRIAPLAVRYFIYASTSTETRMLSDSAGCIGGPGAAVCGAAASWDKESDYALSILDAKLGRELGTKGSVAGHGWYFAVLPLVVGWTTATETQACHKLGDDVLSTLESRETPLRRESP